MSQSLLSQHYRHSVEMDLLLRIEAERHARAVLSLAERAAARRLRAAETGLERALARNAELDERLRQMEGEGQAWQSLAISQQCSVAGLRFTLDTALTQAQSPRAGTGAGEGDAMSAAEEHGTEASGGRARACRQCGEAEVCVLVLPCRHLCLCGGCEAVEACPVCAATKNVSLHVLLS